MTENNFSFIIPVYNEEKYIEDMLTGISKAVAGYEDEIEILIVDAGSTDDTAAAASGALSHRKLNGRVVRLEKQAYPGAARNAGIREAAYENLILLDSGVGFNRWMFSECMNKCDDYDFIWFQSTFVYNDAKGQAYVRPYFIKRKHGRYLRHCFAKRGTVKRLGGFREDLRAAEDWLFYKEAADGNCREYFSGVTAQCQGFAGSLGGFYSKWVTYFEHSVYAGLYKKNIRTSAIQLLFFVILSIAFCIAGINWVVSLIGSLFIYLFLRGFLSFIMSKIPPVGGVDFLYTFITSAVLEAARIAGVARGLANHAGK